MPEVHTKHPTPQQLTDYGLGKLPSAAMTAIHAHLDACAECSRKVENQPPDSFIGQLRAATPQGGTLLPALPTPVPVPSNTVLPGRKMGQINTTLDEVPAELAASTKFDIVGKLGQGGMGAVYKAKHKFLGDHVAIKVMNADVVGNPDARSRFLREMHAAGQLKHPNIVRALDAEQIGDLLVLVMEFVPGITLDQLVAQKGPLPVDFSCNCIMQAAQGLQHAHEKKMIHRDIKPANLMVTAKEKEVKLLDFGLVRGPREQGQKNQTQMQTFMGTPEYVAPEQATDARGADIRSDIYSLGCTLYFLLAGRPPFRGATVMETIVRQIQDDPQPLPEVRAEVPAGLWAVIAKMMAKAPAQRFQTPIEVAEALKPFVAGGAKVARRAAAPTEGVAPPPVRIPPAPPSRTAEQSPFVPLASSPPPVRRRRKQAQGKGKWPAWMVYVVVAAGVLTMSLFALLVLTFRMPKEVPKKDPIANPGLGKEPAKEITNSIGMKLVRIPAGEFTMGSPTDEKERQEHEGPQRRVQITRAFYMGVYEVTQGEYKKVMDKNPSHFSAEGGGNGQVTGDTSRFPVETASYEDALEFCKKLSAREAGKGRVYRLPTEAEWEYACRAGTKAPFHYGESLNSDQANFNGNFPYGGAAKSTNLGRTCEVGSYKPNAFGLYDMHGNVWEWCSDWYDKDTYGKGDNSDPKGPNTGTTRVLRGGSWDYGGRGCRSANRDWFTPGTRYFNSGFRVVCGSP